MFFEYEKYKQMETITEKVVYYSILLYGIFFFFVPMFLVPENPQLETELHNPIIWFALGGALLIQSRHLATDFKGNIAGIYYKAFDLITLALGYTCCIFGLEMLDNIVVIPQISTLYGFLIFYGFNTYLLSLGLIVYRVTAYTLAIINNGGNYAGE